MDREVFSEEEIHESARYYRQGTSSGGKEPDLLEKIKEAWGDGERAGQGELRKLGRALLFGIS